MLGEIQEVYTWINYCNKESVEEFWLSRRLDDVIVDRTLLYNFAIAQDLYSTPNFETAVTCNTEPGETLCASGTWNRRGRNSKGCHVASKGKNSKDSRSRLLSQNALLHRMCCSQNRFSKITKTVGRQLRDAGIVLISLDYAFATMSVVLSNVVE